jgi:N utilization substance protein B
VQKAKIEMRNATTRDPRHEARRVALATLFERTFHSTERDKSIGRILEIYEENEIDNDLLSQLVEGVAENAEPLDKIISETAPAWPPDQITKADLIVLRIAIFELVFAKNVPSKVAIDEAIELAKEFGGTSSGSFVNGVLGTVVKKYIERTPDKEPLRTEEKIKKLLSENLEVDEEKLRRETSFSADLNSDPAELEDVFQKAFGEFEIEGDVPEFGTVGQLIDFIKDYLDEIEE